MKKTDPNSKIDNPKFISKYTTKLTESTCGIPDRERFDNLNSTKRAELYDTLARNMHNPSYRESVRVHLNDFARVNRKFHDLNYPNPQPSNRDQLERVQSPRSSRMMSTSSKLRSTTSSKYKSSTKSKYMSSYILQQEQKQKPIKTLKEQILERTASGDFPEAEKIIAAIIRSLISNGADRDEIQYAFQNISLQFIVNEETSELEICFHL